MLRDTMGRFATENKLKLKWIGKRLFIGIMIALIGSMVIEGAIYGLANKVVEAYTTGFAQVSFK